MAPVGVSPDVVDSSTATTVVAVTGADGDLGRRVVAALGAIPHLAVQGIPARATGTAALPPETTILVHLAPGDHDSLARDRRSALEGTADLLDAADSCDVRTIVLLSSAMAYGAWPNNPVPLTEDAPLRPDEGFVFARQLAAVEQLVDAWRTRHPGAHVAVLRPVPAMAAEGTSTLVRALAAGLGLRAGEEGAPSQFLHLDDLASAIVLAVSSSLDGVYNVAPDGAIDPSTLRSLTGSPPRPRLPGWAADTLAAIRWRFQRGPIPPGLRPYTRWPWLVANDRLKAQGWVPAVTNEQAYVEGTEARWWTMLTPKRKQELSLAAMATGLVVVVAVGVWLVRLRSRRA